MIPTRIANAIIKWCAYGILFFGGCLFAGTFIYMSCCGVTFANREDGIDLEKTTGPIGDFVGGVVGTVFTLASALLVVVTLREQSQHNRRDHFVQNYFEMLKMHSENVQAMVVHNPKSGDTHGREVFSLLVNSYNQTYAIVHSYMEHILNGGLHGNPNEQQIVKYLQDSHSLCSLEMRLSYGYFFFGSDSYLLSSPKDSVETLIEQEVLRLLNYNQLYIKGNHVMLGHYYRHMYQMIMLIISQQDLNESERYTYAKQLRAQLNDDEQLLLYYNVMAEVGSEWLVTSVKGKIKKIEEMCPIARFRMIKNIPSVSNIRGVNPYFQFKDEIAVYKGLNLRFFEQS